MKGMYSRIYTSYDLGPGFWNRECHFQDSSCGEYWLDPSGKLWTIDYTGCAVFGDNGNIQKSGCNGKIYVSGLTREIIIMPAEWTVKYAPYPQKKVLFINGILEGYK